MTLHFSFLVCFYSLCTGKKYLAVGFFCLVGFLQEEKKRLNEDSFNVARTDDVKKHFGKN